MSSELVTPEIAQRLNSKRQQLRVSQSEIARALKTSQTTVQKILIGEARKSEFVRPMWKFLGLPMEELAALTQGSQAKDAPVHPAAVAHDFITNTQVIESKGGEGQRQNPNNDNEHNAIEEATVVSRERVIRMFGVHFGWTRPTIGEPERVMRVYHADGSVRSYVIDRQLRSLIARAMVTDAAADGEPQS